MNEEMESNDVTSTPTVDTAQARAVLRRLASDICKAMTTYEHLMQRVQNEKQPELGVLRREYWSTAKNLNGAYMSLFWLGHMAAFTPLSDEDAAHVDEVEAEMWRPTDPQTENGEER